MIGYFGFYFMCQFFNCFSLVFGFKIRLINLWYILFTICSLNWVNFSQKVNKHANIKNQEKKPGHVTEVNHLPFARCFGPCGKRSLVYSAKTLNYHWTGVIVKNIMQGQKIGYGQQKNHYAGKQRNKCNNS